MSKKMATRYDLRITFGGNESEAPKNWHVYALNGIAASIAVGNTSGEVLVYQEDEPRRVWWDLHPEDE